jgi:beta propeller repeat protein
MPAASHHWSYRAALLVCLFTLAAGVAPASSAGAAAAPSPFPVCIELGGQAGPSIARNIVAWTDNRRGNFDIFARNIATKRNFAVCTNKAAQDNPSVGRYVTGGATHYLAVWVDHRHRSGTSSSIYARDLTTHAKAFPVTASRNNHTKWFPRVAGDWVVWVQENPAGGYAVVAKNLSSGASHRVATTGVVSPLGVSQRTVGTTSLVTVVYTSGDGDISARDLPDGKPFVVSQTSKFEWSPDISGNRVVWWESGGRVMLKNLTSGKRTLVALGSRPRIDGTRVVWDGGGRGGEFTVSYKAGAAVYVDDVTRSAPPVKISQPHQTCLFAAISGRTVVWEAGPAQRIFEHIHVYGAHVR